MAGLNGTVKINHLKKFKLDVIIRIYGSCVLEGALECLAIPLGTCNDFFKNCSGKCIDDKQAEPNQKNGCHLDSIANLIEQRTPE